MCPKLTLFSFVTFIVIVDIIMFSAELFYDGLKPGGYINATSYALDKFGDKNPYKMRYDYQLHRFIMPMFLHSSGSHIFFNLLATMMIGA